jgi:phospholipid-binding lipoprotein MlaA
MPACTIPLPAAARAAAASIVLLLAGCASAPQHDPRDPFEGFNRGVTRFNDGVDHAVFRPVAKTYVAGVPRPVRQGVSNFFGNLRDVWSTVNSALQLKFQETAQGVARVTFNTIFGLGGILDVAEAEDMERHPEDFGLTLARWGAPGGPYLVLPLFGPSTLRDALALPVDWFGNPVSAVDPIVTRNLLYSARAVDTRASMLPLDTLVDDGALDKYTFVRDAYLQHRHMQIAGESDGREPVPDTRPDAAMRAPIAGGHEEVTE